MSDYLSTLAARSLQREPACRPRRAQMFEPRRETPDSPFAEEVHQALPAAETFERGAAEAPPRAPIAPADYGREQGGVNEPRARALDNPARVPPQVRGDAPDSHASTRGTEAPQTSVTTQTSDPSHGPLHSEATDEPQAPHAPREVRVFPQSPPRTPPSVDVQTDEVADTGRTQLPTRRPSSDGETQTAPPSDSEAPPPARPSSKRVTEGALAAEVFDEERRERSHAVLRREATESKGALTVADAEVFPQPLSQTQSGTPSLSLTQVRPVTAQSATTNTQAREANTQPPTIEVTIGRIEVRAVTPPAPPPPRRRQTPPKMSLDDYLRAQSGGRG